MFHIIRNLDVHRTTETFWAIPNINLTKQFESAFKESKLCVVPKISVANHTIKILSPETVLFSN